MSDEENGPLKLVSQVRDNTRKYLQDISEENALNIWVVSDNLRKGAALNAVQIAEALVAGYLDKAA